MHSLHNRRKSRPLVILLTLVLLWSQIGFMASPAFAETTKPTSVSQEVYAYKDITPAQPNYIFVNYLKKAGLIAGFPDGTFRTQAGLTRAEAATVLAKAAGLKAETAATGFKDVSTKHWAASNIAAAKKAGLISGYPNGTFRPEAMITRAEGITLILKLSKQSESGIALPTLTDVTPKHWAAGAIATGLAAEMVSLSSDNQHFLPNTKLDRGSLARALSILLTRDPALYQTVLPNSLTVTTGTVTVIRANSSTSESINNSTVLNIGDSLTVDPASSADLKFPDGTGLHLEQNTALTIKDSKGRSYIKPDGTPGIAVESLNVDLKRGKLFGALASSTADNNDSAQTVSTKIRAASLGSYKTITSAAAAKPLPWWKQAGVKRTKVKVDMPTGVAAIRGTFWENQVANDGSFKTSLLTGDATVTSSSGQDVSLTAGQRTEVTTAAAPPVPPAPLTVTDRQEWVQVASWAQQQATVIAQNQEQALPPPPPADIPTQIPSPTVPQPQTPQPQVPTPPIPPAPPVPDITQLIYAALTNVGATNLTPPAVPLPIPPTPPALPPIPSSSSSSVSVTAVTLNHTNLSLMVGQDPISLTATVLPNDATYKIVTWTSSNPSVATLVTGANNAEVKVNPLAAGTTTVTVTTSNGFTATCNIKVTFIPVSFLTLNTSEIGLEVGGSPYILIPLIAPSNATNKSITWSSTEPTVASVVNGIIVPLSQGETTITATTADGGKEASCQVYVIDYLAGH